MKFPLLIQDVQTLAFLTVPSGRTTLTGWRLGICLYILCLCEKESFEAFLDVLPHISQTTDIFNSPFKLKSSLNVRL